MRRRTLLAGTLLAGTLVLLIAGPAFAQVDLSGEWAARMHEDNPERGGGPEVGEYQGLPINDAARARADAWDLAADNAAGNECRAFGAAAIMRMPTRVRISWQDDNILKLETDAGQQTRLFRFAEPAPGGIVTTPGATAAGERTWQGVSDAQWFRQPQTRGLGFGGRGPLPGGSLRVVTRHLRAGYLQKYGVPYSEDAVVTDAYHRHDEPNGFPKT